ncbi:MAG: TMEM43 family protein [Chloroflexota bacterium]
MADENYYDESTDSYVEVTTQSWWSRLMSSFVGVLIGLLVFFASFFVLWTNEGRVDVSEIAEGSIAVNAANVDPAGQGQLVAVSGVLNSDEQIGDPDYLVPGNYIELRRSVEMYAWVEEKETETERNTGGSETTTTTYTYEKKWTSSPRDSSNFKRPDGHQNPTLTIDDAVFTVASANVGAYRINVDDANLPSARELSLTSAMMTQANARIESNYIVQGEGTLAAPLVGDVRIQYRVIPNNLDVTVFGQQEENRVVAYYEGENRLLYRVYEGTREEGIATMRSEHVMISWLLRLVGFLMMWFGLSALFGPINTFLDILPALGSVSRFVFNAITFLIALVFSAITIIISIIAHNIIALIVTLVIVTLIGWYIISQRRRNSVPELAS